MTTKVRITRKLLDAVVALTDREPGHDCHEVTSPSEPPPCPCCGGRMKMIESFDGPLSRPYHVRKLDSS